MSERSFENNNPYFSEQTDSTERKKAEALKWLEKAIERGIVADDNLDGIMAVWLLKKAGLIPGGFKNIRYPDHEKLEADKNGDYSKAGVMIDISPQLIEGSDPEFKQHRDSQMSSIVRGDGKGQIYFDHHGPDSTSKSGSSTRKVYEWLVALGKLPTEESEGGKQFLNIVKFVDAYDNKTYHTDDFGPEQLKQTAHNAFGLLKAVRRGADRPEPVFGWHKEADSEVRGYDDTAIRLMEKTGGDPTKQLTNEELANLGISKPEALVEITEEYMDIALGKVREYRNKGKVIKLADEAEAIIDERGNKNRGLRDKMRGVDIGDVLTAAGISTHIVYGVKNDKKGRPEKTTATIFTYDNRIHDRLVEMADTVGGEVTRNIYVYNQKLHSGGLPTLKLEDIQNSLKTESKTEKKYTKLIIDTTRPVSVSKWREVEKLYGYQEYLAGKARQATIAQAKVEKLKTELVEQQPEQPKAEKEAEAKQPETQPSSAPEIENELIRREGDTILQESDQSCFLAVLANIDKLYNRPMNHNEEAWKWTMGEDGSNFYGKDGGIRVSRLSALAKQGGYEVMKVSTIVQMLSELMDGKMLVIAASTRREGQRHAVLVHLNKAKNGLILRDPSKNPLLKGENVTELPLSEEQLIDLIGLSRNKTTDKGRSIEDLFKYTVVIGRPGAKAAAELPVKGYGTDARFSGLTAERRYEMEHQLSPEDRLRAIYYDAHPPAVFKDKALQKAWNRGMDKAFRFELIQLNKEPDNERHAYLDKLQRKFVARKIVSLEQDALIRREDTKFLCHQAELLTQLSEEEQHISSRFYSPDERAKLLSRIAKRKQHIQYTQSLLGDDKDGDRYIKENERDIRNLAADFEILDREMRVSEYLKPANIESLKKDIWDEYDKDPNDDNYTDPLNKVQKQIESFESIRTSNEFKNWLKEQTIDKINKINALIDADIAQLVDYGEAVDDIRNWFSLPTSNIDIDEGHRLVENYVRIQTRLPLLIARLNAQFSEAKISRDDEEEGENHQVVA